MVMSVVFPHPILGPEMAAPKLWAPGMFCSFCRPTKFLVLGGGILGGEGGGKEVPI